MEEFDAIRDVTHIQTLGEVTLLSLRLQAARREPHDPDWLENMANVTKLDHLQTEDLAAPSPEWVPKFPTPGETAASGTGAPSQRSPSPPQPTPGKKAASRPEPPDAAGRNDRRPEGPDLNGGLP